MIGCSYLFFFVLVLMHYYLVMYACMCSDTFTMFVLFMS